MKERVQTLERALGRNLRARRIAQDLTQEDLGRRANVSVGAVRNLEAGRGTNVSTLLAVCSVLEVTEWIERVGPPPPAFSPLDLLAARQRDAGRRTTDAPRVRRARRR